MAVKIEKLNREFVFEDKTLPDPNPALTPEEVATHYSSIHPELVTAKVGKPKEKGGKMVYTFEMNAGTKG